MRIGIAIDFGTSAFRAQAVDLEHQGHILCTATTSRHPLPGCNVIDHLDFAIQLGIDRAQSIVMAAVNSLIDSLTSDNQTVTRLAICGNPIQLSIFQGIEIRDLAYAGKSKLKSLGVVSPSRDACIVYAKEINGLDLPQRTKVLIPPAVFHAVGADTLAMIIQSGFMDSDEIAIATDYGTNAEMALKVGDLIYTGSTAAGPAIEGQQLESGMLALPGAICDVEFEPRSGCFKTWILDQSLAVTPGETVNPITGEIFNKGTIESLGITGTGVIALLDQAQKSGLIKLPRIDTLDKCIKLSKRIRFTENDLIQSGKAVGAFKAGHRTLCHVAGIDPEKVKAAYLCGATGTYVDPIKAKQSGLYPENVQVVYQVGNTSLAMARKLIWDETLLEKMQDIANKIKQHHCMFALSKMFKQLYILELSYWTEGMPKSHYGKSLKRYGFSNPGEVLEKPNVIRQKNNDFGGIGNNKLKIVTLKSDSSFVSFKECTGCLACIQACPEDAIQFKESSHGNRSMKIDYTLCNGPSCRICEKTCKDKVLKYIDLLM